MHIAKGRRIGAFGYTSQAPLSRLCLHSIEGRPRAIEELCRLLVDWQGVAMGDYCFGFCFTVHLI